MTFEELLAHNYEIMKHGADWVGFRIVYSLNDEKIINDYWEIVGVDPHDDDEQMLLHAHSSDDPSGRFAGIFSRKNCREYWSRQLMWYYEINKGLR